MIDQRIQSFRREMEKREIDIYIIPTADFHQSEYVGDYFKCRQYMTGFTGSAGTAVITKEEANLWTDGRYFIQAQHQLEKTEVILRKEGEPGVPSISEYLKQVSEKITTERQKRVIIGVDGRTISIAEGQRYEKITKTFSGDVAWQEDLVGTIWKDRPERSCEPVVSLDVSYAGESVASKLCRVREKMKEKGAEYCVITGLDDIGWLLNLRGNDVEYSPLILSYVVVAMDHVELYGDEKKFSSEITKQLKENHVLLRPYDEIYDRMAGFEENAKVMFDPEQMNYAMYKRLPEKIKKIPCENPVILMKAMKNEVEIKNIRNAHIKDGVACTKFMYWLKTHVEKEKITEMSASDHLENLRGDQKGFLEPSFGPICAYKDHAAIVHYSSTPETNVELRPEGMILCDTGGHYIEGSTDITRTIVLGNISEEEKQHFTTVLCSMLNLADARFLYGCSGMSLDYAAREPFWRQHLNYNHGTGHGVGYLGNVHEPPQRFFWKAPVGSTQLGTPLEEGMVITDEPGIYIENFHGIRIENELLVRKDVANEYGQFMYFETLTFVPIDLDGVIPQQMTEREKQLLNIYHKQVWEKISPYLTEEERLWLQKYTREI